MIVVVTGSRSWVESPRRLEVKAKFLEEIARLEPTQVYHGGAKGPDSWAAFEFPEIAVAFHAQPTPGRTPAQRLFDRNIRMIETAMYLDDTVAVVSCWDGESRGTRHAMKYAKDNGVLVCTEEELK